MDVGTLLTKIPIVSSHSYHSNKMTCVSLITEDKIVSLTPPSSITIVDSPQYTTTGNILKKFQQGNGGDARFTIS